jgi:hypothetical protein
LKELEFVGYIRDYMDNDKALQEWYRLYMDGRDWKDTVPALLEGVKLGKISQEESVVLSLFIGFTTAIVTQLGKGAGDAGKL